MGTPRPNAGPEPLGVARFTSTLFPASSCMRPLANTLSTAASSSYVMNLRGGGQGSVTLWLSGASHAWSDNGVAPQQGARKTSIGCRCEG